MTRQKRKAGGAQPPTKPPIYENVLLQQDIDTSSVKMLCQRLSSSDVRLRDRALERVPAMLSARVRQAVDDTRAEVWDMLEEDMKYLWKGLFFYYYHTDGWKAQDAAADTITRWTSEVFSKETTLKSCVLWAKVGWVALTREWPHIDKWRLNKYMYFVRRYVFHLLRTIPIDEFSTLVRSLFAHDDVQDLCMHVVDVLLDECLRAPRLSNGVLDEVLETVVLRTLTRHPNRALLNRIEVWVLKPLKRLCFEIESPETDPKTASKNLSVPQQEQTTSRSHLIKTVRTLVKKMKHSIIDPDTLDANRSNLIRLHKDLSLKVLDE